MEALKKTALILKNTLFKDKYFVFLSVFFFIFLTLYRGRFGSIIIDCGREAYIPYAMADLGKVLFKDIVCIYGPVPYYLNALFVKLFGAALNTMYFIGALLSYIFLFGIYNLANRFLKAHLTFIYCLIILFVCILNPSISNYIFPYSYAIVYALVFAVFHLVFLFKFVDETALRNLDCKNLCISALFLALCLLSKLDFIPCALPFLLTMFKYRKNLALKNFGAILFSFSVPFFILLSILIFQKVSLQNLIFNFKMISNMAHSPSLKYFYTVCTGYFFDFKKTFMFVPQFLSLALIFIVSGFLGYFASGIKKTPFRFFVYSAIILISAGLFFHFELIRYIFLYMPLIVLGFLVLKFLKYIFFTCKKFKNPSAALSDNGIIIYSFILFSLLFSLKTLFGLFHELYGGFYLPFILLSFLIIISLIFKNYFAIVSEMLKTSGIIIIFIFIVQNFLIFFGVNAVSVNTPAGTIFTEKPFADSFNTAIKFLKNNLHEEDEILPLPEGLMLNFVFKNDYKFFNTSFTPLDFDAYGEDYLVHRLLLNKPRYIIWFLRSYEDYGKTFLCKDFGQEFCRVLNENYILKSLQNKDETTFLNPQTVRIFERKNND